MARTQARAGFGLKLYIGDGATPTETFNEIIEVTSITPAGGTTTDTVEVTHLNSDNATKEFIPTLHEEPELDFEANWIPGNTQHDRLETVRAAKTLCNFRIVYPGVGKRSEGAGYVTMLNRSSPLDGAMKLQGKIKRSGKWNIVADP